MYDILQKIEVFQQLERELSAAPVPVALSGCMESQKIQLTAELAKNYGWTLYICRDERDLAGIGADFRNFEANTCVYPAKDLLFYSSDLHGNYITNERMSALRHLVEEPHGVLVTTIDGLMDRISAKKTVQEEALKLFEGMVISTDKLAAVLQRLGYERVAQVELAGQFALRGGIADIYPMTMDDPCRVEFFDDEVDTIRRFEPESQRSVERLPSVMLYPADEQAKGAGTAEKRVSLLRYFGDDALIVLDEPQRLFERAKAVETEFRESMAQRLKKGVAEEMEAHAATDIFSAAETMERLKTRRSLLLTGLDEPLRDFGAQKRFEIRTAAAGKYQESFELLIGDLKRFQQEGWRVTILTPSRTRLSHLAEQLRDYGIHAFCPDAASQTSGRSSSAKAGVGAASAASATEGLSGGGKISASDADYLKPGQTEVVQGTLRAGFLYPDAKYALLTEQDLFGIGELRRKRRKKRFEGKKLTSLNELSVGDYVVHESHGIGIYRGLEHIEREGCGKDYIKIEYADSGNLYLPASKLELVQKFSGAEGHKPKLNKLGGTEWSRTKQRVAHAAKDIAKELVALYAARSRAEGFRCGPDTVWQKEFEELFPYEETEDQLAAIDAVKQDMESGRVMDRLVCGDVGYGKTEIALRAAFKAVQEGKQVAYLVPTTILAQQHYNTFADRMRGFPVNIAMMSRFNSNAENKKVAERLAAGTVDIVIGTHRILSSDVKFKNIGLLIIDEEQRFGVAHKEKIKQLKTNIDVLTLTATPIPRTLHMSLAGIRDLSVLEEPPMDRVPIQTYVMEYNDELVREAVHREVARGGQVFYVYNRVKDIQDKVARLKSLLPDVEIAYAHGQMNERELEEVMLDFVEGRTDVLVSTTIIETGLDIANANTLIVDGAERMGLSQLYQIRGRVGRSNRTAYAFLMYRKDKLLSEDAEKRLRAIREFTELGAGIKIAMRDLEIRGAGNVLGAEQHGQMEAVGYELYCKLLREAVGLLQGKTAETEQFETSVECDIDAFIPDSYIPNEHQKLDIYKRISDIQDREDSLDIVDELTDRFGDLPASVENLLKIALLRATAHKAYATDVAIRKDGFTIEMYPEAKIKAECIPELIVAEGGKLRFLRGQAPRFQYRETRPKAVSVAVMLEKASEIMNKLLI